MKDNKDIRIYLYSHSPEAEKAINSGEAAISSGGARRSDGTMMEMAKPLSFTVDELKEMVSNNEKLITTDQKIMQLSAKLDLSEQGIQELSRVEWLNNAILGQAFSITFSGFQQTLAGIEYITDHLEELGRYVQQRDLNNIKEKTERFLSYLTADSTKLTAPRFDVTNSTIDEHLNDIAAFIKRNYDGILDGSIDGFLAASIVEALIVPFTSVAVKYDILFFYDNGISSGGSDKWFELIKTIVSNYHFKEKLQYYVHLNTELPFQDKVHIGRERTRKLASLPAYIIFEQGYTLTHTKEEYLKRPETIRKILDNPDKIPEDRKIYL